MSNEITFPSGLVERLDFFKKINENNTRVYGHVEYLRELVTNMHSMYNQLCKKMMQASEESQRKVANVSKVKTEHSEVVLEFIRSISFLHFSISNQLNSNSVTLGTKTHRIARNRLDTLKERLSGCEDINQEYIHSVDEFNKNEKSFREKCEYFKDYEKDVMKYYSVKANVELHQKLQTKEIQLKEAHEDIFRKKQDYQANIHEIRAGIKDYFELQQNIISEYSKLLLNIRKIGNRQNAQLYIQPIMEEPSDQMNTSTNRIEGIMTNRSERPSDRSIAQERKEIIREQEKVVALERLLNEYLGDLQDAVKIAGDTIDQMREASEYRKFINDKMVMSEILPINAIREIDLIVNEISVFRTIILNLNSHFGKFKVLQEISKYRILNYEKFIDEAFVYLQMQKKMLSMSSRSQYLKLQAKFKERNAELMSRGRQRITQLQKAIFSEYYREQILYSQSNIKKNVHNDIFQKPYYEILMHSFFLNRNENNPFIENPHLKKLSQNMSANLMQNTMTLVDFYKPKKKKGKRTCCGLFSGDEEDDGPPVIEDFHCALKDGIMLIQGKMKLYSNYLCFTSMFNSKTLFGYSDIRVPKWDILQILSDTHLLSLKVVIETKYGNLQFTSFVSNPYDSLVRLYESKKNGFSTFHKNEDGETEAGILEERFQSQFQAELLKMNIVVDKLSTYLSEDRQKLSISIEYHINGSSSHSLFEIKILQTSTSLEYAFIHDEHCKNNDIKTILENVSKELINRKKPTVKTNRLHEIGKEDNIQCSIIEGNENNKMSFQREPSFIVGGVELEEGGNINLEEIRLSQLSLGHLLSQKNVIDIDKNINFENRMGSPPAVRRVSSRESEMILDNILLNTARTSGESSNKEEKSLAPKSSRRIEKVVKVLSVPCEELKAKANDSKTSKLSHKMTARSQSSLKPGSEPNYKYILIIVGVVLVLNILCKMISNE